MITESTTDLCDGGLIQAVNTVFRPGDPYISRMDYRLPLISFRSLF
jgi:hypothetical protein